MSLGGRSPSLRDACHTAAGTVMARAGLLGDVHGHGAASCLKTVLSPLLQMSCRSDSFGQFKPAKEEFAFPGGSRPPAPKMIFLICA